MRIQQADYEMLKSAIRGVLNQYPSAKEEYKGRGLTINRFRWDVFAKANTINGFLLSRKLYIYLNDSHIQTALRRIIPEEEGEI